MTTERLTKEFEALTFADKVVVGILALTEEYLTRAQLAHHAKCVGKHLGQGKGANIRADATTLDFLQQKGLIAAGGGVIYRAVDEIRHTAVRAMFKLDIFAALCAGIEAADPLPHRHYSGTIQTRDFEQALTRLKMALLQGMNWPQVNAWLSACAPYIDGWDQHPFILICGDPFDPELFARLDPGVRDEVMAVLIENAGDDPWTAPPLRAWLAENPIKATASDKVFAVVTEDFLLRGRLGEAMKLIECRNNPWAEALGSAISLLRDDHAGGLTKFEVALKAHRKQGGPRAYFSGLSAFLYVLSLLRDNDAKKTLRAEAYLREAAQMRDVQGRPFEYISRIIQARKSAIKPESVSLEGYPSNLLSLMFQFLVTYWLDKPKLLEVKAALTGTYATAQENGFLFVAAQIAELLGRLGQAEYAAAAATLRAEFNVANLVDWLQPQEAWQRQLAALAGLAPSTRAAPTESSVRLVWMIQMSGSSGTVYSGSSGAVHIEPREQKRSARGDWTAGRAVALNRLLDDVKPEYNNPLDRPVIACILRVSEYFGQGRCELNTRAALVALVGHPLVFWSDAPTVRVELLSGEPQLLIEEKLGSFKFSIQPPLQNEQETVVATKETPTRLRVTKVSDEHRRIAAIVGDGLSVPAHAKQLVLDAIASISSLVTVHSDVAGGAANVRQVEADPRLHAHLLPYDAGLKLQVLVRPFANAGPYFAPGGGPEGVIAEIAGQPCQARRNLKAESKAAADLSAACPALALLEPVHGEWLIDEPSAALELLVQLQAQTEHVVIAWPEGEKFKVRRQLDSKMFFLSIERENNWFNATGELQIAEDKVVDLRKLLELLRQSSGRFIPLGGNEFVALTDEFKRRLQDLDAFGDAHGAGVRVHPLAAFALEELVDDAGELRVDRHWKEHRKRLREVDSLQPQLPSTLQAELRDYQVAGFEWLSRLAHWGAGACLADDMGLGKTLQALALILSRAQQGPALVVAPTSVCMNWQAEAARFTPTLNLIMFGAGNRQQTLATLKPFDLVVASYGLLQLETEMFTGVQWHTVVLDEAQAIKNRDTKRAQAALALRSDFKIVATGTPLENHLGELWTLFHFTNPGLLGSHEQFDKRFAGPIERRQDADARAQLRRLIQPFILRRTKTQVLTELPSRTEIVRQVDLSAEETALYEALRREALERLASLDAPEGAKHLQILVEIMKLRRACCHPQLVAPKLNLPGSKLAVFGELLDELLENHHKALVFSQFVDHLTLIRAYLDERGVRYQYLDGATPMQARKTRVDAFQAGDGDVFLISLKAGGTGLNLTAADYVIHMDPWWNPAVEDQASDRAHRMGQQRPVTIYRLVARHTIEEKIVQMHQHKRDLADSLLGGGDVTGKMSADAILKLLEEEFRE